MKKLAILIMFIVCISATAHKSFAQSKSVQDKLMKHKWVENNKFWNSTPGYLRYTKDECIYITDIDNPADPYICSYYLSDNINSKTFDYDKAGEAINGKYLYVQVGNIRTNAYIYEILKLNNRKLIIKMVYPDPRSIIGLPSIRHYKAKRL